MWGKAWRKPRADIRSRRSTSDSSSQFLGLEEENGAAFKNRARSWAKRENRHGSDQSSPLGEGHLDVVARQQRSVGELELEHLPFIVFVLVVRAWWVC